MSSDSADKVDGAVVDPELSDFALAIKRAIEIGLRVTAPGRVVTFDPLTCTATVRLETLRVIDVRGEDVPDIPILLSNVPVRFDRSELGGVTYPITAGVTTGHVHFTDRSLAAWLQNGNPVAPVDPESGRTHDLGDGFFEPGLMTLADAVAAGPIDVTATVLDGAALVKLGALANDFATKAAALTTAIDAALAAASLAVVPADGGAAAFTAFTTAWNLAKASIAATKAMVE